MSVPPAPPSAAPSPDAPSTGPARPWLGDAARERIAGILAGVDLGDLDAVDEAVHRAVADDVGARRSQVVDLDPASNVMNPRAEALLSSGIGTRPSLGHPGEKYEAGLEHIERIEVLADALVRRVFGAPYAEARVTSGAMANLAGFLATCSPGDAVVVPPATIGGHVTHHRAGVAGLLGLEIHEAPVDADGYTVDPAALGELAERVRPALITVAGSCNLRPHPVRAIREVADGVGARVLFDAAHVCGLLAGGVWRSPLDDGADLVTMSTYKSLAGPPGGLVLTADPELAARVDAIVHPGLTANFDAARLAALAITMLDWLAFGDEQGEAMVATAARLATALAEAGVPVFATRDGFTGTHQLAVDARRWGGGQHAARRLRAADLLACGIGLPVEPVPADDVPGLRLGTSELVRWGMTEQDMPALARLLADALEGDPAAVRDRVHRFRAPFTRLRFVRP